MIEYNSKEFCMDFKKIDESFDRYKEKKFTARGLVRYLCYEEGLSFTDVWYLCASTLKEDFDERIFIEAIADVALDGLPYKGYVVDDGAATICGSKETC